MNWPRLNTRPATRRRRSWRPRVWRRSTAPDVRRYAPSTSWAPTATSGWSPPAGSSTGRPGSTATSRPSPPTPRSPATCTWRGPTITSGWSPPAGSSTGAPGSTATSRPSPPMPPATCTWRGPTTISGWSPPAGSSTGHLGRRQRPGLHPRPLCRRLPVRGGDRPQPLAGVPRLGAARGTWVDGNVQAFTPDPYASGYLYVEGTDHNLWLESPGWEQHGRTWVDGNVQAFAPA